MDPLHEALKGASAADRTLFRPVLYRLPADREGLVDLLKRESRLQVFDHLHGQLTELVRSLNPSVRFSAADLDAAAIAHLNGIRAEEYGVWVYYPWSQRLVHLLDEHEFAQVRTDRNRNKITREEQALLATKKVGVIGLSVGQSVSLTMALERSFGEIRLADFDTLELSNLNRIRSGVHHLGVSKVVNVAREIAEIDPFLAVTCFHEGITRGNIDQFLTEGGKLDVLVEECDSVDVKLFSRLRARAWGIPVIMDTSDRGMIDVERFDLEPERPILHGLVDHLDLELAAKARTNEEKLPFVLPIAGMETLSPRMKASMLEIENTVTTWPQLASSVVMGGGIGGHLTRRLLLAHPIPSGRWWIDPDDSIGVVDQEPKAFSDLQAGEATYAAGSTLTNEVMIELAERFSATDARDALSHEEAADIAVSGAQAPSGGNCQPWRFLHHRGRLLVFLDGERAKSMLDPGLRYAFLAIGGAVENMLITARDRGIILDHSFSPVEDGNAMAAVLEVRSRGMDPVDPEDRELARYVSVRCTNRRTSERTEFDPRWVSQLIGSANKILPGSLVSIVTERRLIERAAELCGKAERIRFLNRNCHHDMFVREMRWTPEEAERTRDGIDVATLELSLTDRTGLRIASDPKAMGLLRKWGAGKAMEKMAAKGIRASSALAVISVPDLTLSDAYQAGRAMERLWLKATALGLLAHPVGAPIFMGIHGLWDDERILSNEEHAEAQAILGEFRHLLSLEDATPFFMLRLGESGPPSARSLRLPLEDVFLSSLGTPHFNALRPSTPDTSRRLTNENHG